MLKNDLAYQNAIVLTFYFVIFIVKEPIVKKA